MRYVLCRGASGMFGWSVVEDNKTLPYILEKELKQKFKIDSIRTINAGLGITSRQGTRRVPIEDFKENLQEAVRLA